MMILVLETIHKRGFCKGRRRKTRHRLRCITGKCQIVETQVFAIRLRDGHGVIAWFQVMKTIGPRTGSGLGIGVERHRDIQLVYHGVVHGHRPFKVTVVAQHHRQRTAGTIASQRIVLRGTCFIKGLVIEVPTTVIPGEVVHLIERVIIVVRRIIGRSEGRTVNRQRLTVAGRQEIAAHIRIRIARAREGIPRRPRHRSYAIEEPSSTDGDGGHLSQIIGLSKVITRQLLGLQRSAIAVDLHFRGIREARFLQQGIRQLINAALGNTDLRPRALSQHRVLRISFALSCPPHISLSSFLFPRSSDIQLKAHQLLVLPVAEHERDKRHIEHTLFP